MNCEKAREIVDSTLNGEEHIMAAAARDHIGQCASCQEWEAGMLRTLQTLDSLPEPQVPDISAMVMSQLPDAHPASLRLELGKRPLLGMAAWVGAGWALVIAIAAVMLAGVSSGWLTETWSYGRTIGGMFGPVAAAGRSLFDVVSAFAGALIGTSAAWIMPLLWFVLIDCALLAAVLLSLRRRARTISACFI